MPRVPFILPAIPRLRASPPKGENWQHEVKLDGYRVQLHKHGHAVSVLSRNGADFTRRFQPIAAAVLGLPIRSCVIDGELIAADASGQPDFRALLYGRTAGECVYAFDLLELQSRDIRDQPLMLRRARLAELLIRADSRVIRFSESFPDADTLLAECARRDLEGIVSKRKDFQYRSGIRSGWIKVKTQVWKDANKDRWKLFEKNLDLSSLAPSCDKTHRQETQRGISYTRPRKATGAWSRRSRCSPYCAEAPAFH